jgi:hypothetical protein
MSFPPSKDPEIGRRVNSSVRRRRSSALALAYLTLGSIAVPFAASAQLVAPLTTSDGRVACLQGMTGIGRPPHWEAVADKEALGGWALSETARDATDLHFPLCISTQTIARDLDATLRFKLLSGTRERAAGLVFRAQDATDYYVVKASALDGSVRLYRMLGGRRSQLAAKDAELKTGQWYTLRVVAKEDSIEVWLDKTSLIDITDRGLMRPGTVGVWSQADSVAHFDSLIVAPPP